MSCSEIRRGTVRLSTVFNATFRSPRAREILAPLRLIEIVRLGEENVFDSPGRHLVAEYTLSKSDGLFTDDHDIRVDEPGAEIRLPFVDDGFPGAGRPQSQVGEPGCPLAHGVIELVQGRFP